MVTLDILCELKSGGAVGGVDQDEDPSMEELAARFDNLSVCIVIIASELQVPHVCRCSRPWFG